MSTRTAIVFAVFAAFVAAVVATSSQLVITGAGATFPEPLYRRFLVEFGRTKPLAKIGYRATGSAAGVTALAKGEAAFADTDVALDDKDLAALKAPVVEIPLCAGAVVAAFHIDGVSSLRLDAHALAGIYLGRITRWDDPAIAALNPGVALPSLAIVPVHRDDASGTSYVFTAWLHAHDDAWRSASPAGATEEPHIAAGRGATGSAGVVALVSSTPGAVGYIEERYAAEAHLPSAAIANDDGRFVSANEASIAAATADALSRVDGDGTRVVVSVSGRGDAYPIASFTYVVVFQDLHNLRSAKEAEALAQYLSWSTHDGQALVPRLHFAPLSSSLRAPVEHALASLSYGGEPLLAPNAR